jgi:acetylornithine deacetylase/succinyl-diaminopimelate desuccinylase-like protein
VGRAAVWARVPGSGRGRPVVLLSHLDVVPAEPGEWAVGPFEGVSAGGYVVGRGSLDAKGIAVVHLLALVELARRPTPLGRDVILLAVPDEETGGTLGSGWLARERPDLCGAPEFLLARAGRSRPARQRPGPLGRRLRREEPCWIELVARRAEAMARRARGRCDPDPGAPRARPAHGAPRA